MKKIFILFLIFCPNTILSSNSPKTIASKTPPPSPQQRPNPIHHEIYPATPLENLSLTNSSFPPAPPPPDRIGRSIPTSESKNWGFRFTIQDYCDPEYKGPNPTNFSSPKNLFYLMQNLINANPIYPHIQITGTKLPYLQQLILKVYMTKIIINGEIQFQHCAYSKYTVKYHKNSPEASIPENLSLFDIFSHPKSAKTDQFNNETSADISLILAAHPNIAESTTIAQILNVLQSGSFIREEQSKKISP